MLFLRYVILSITHNGKKDDAINARIASGTLFYFVSLFAVLIAFALLIPHSLVFSSSSNDSNDTSTIGTQKGSGSSWLGIEGSDMTQEIADLYGLNTTEGVLVANVIEGSPAGKAGIHGGNQSIFINGTYFKPGDVILKIGTKKLSGFKDLLDVISTKNVGDPLDLTVLHNGATKQMTLTLASKPDSFKYENPVYGLEMTYPSSWKVEENGLPYTDDVAVLYPSGKDNKTNFLTLTVYDFLNKIKLEDFVKDYFNASDTDGGNCKVHVSSSNVTLFGSPAYQQSKTCKDYSIFQIASVTGNRAYLIDYELDADKLNKYLPSIQKMIESMKFNASETTQQSQSELRFKTYTNPIYKLSLTYPVNWKISRPQTFEAGRYGFESFFSPYRNTSQTIPGQVILSIMNFSHNIPLKEFTNINNKDLMELEDFKLLKSNSTLLAQEPARAITYNYTESETGDPVKSMEIWTVKDDKAYILTYAAEPSDYDSYLSIAEKMINSFKFTK
jgi:PDZ domain-containing protein/photosystem II reaction center protein PsbP